MSADSATIISPPFALSFTISTFAGRIAALRIVTFFSLTFAFRYCALAPAAYEWANTQHTIGNRKRKRNFIAGPPGVWDLSRALIRRAPQHIKAASNSLGVDGVRRELEILRILTRGFLFPIELFVKHAQAAMRARVEAVQVQRTQKKFFRLGAVCLPCLLARGSGKQLGVLFLERAFGAVLRGLLLRAGTELFVGELGVAWTKHAIRLR